MRELFSTVRSRIIFALILSSLVSMIAGVIGLQGISGLNASLNDIYTGSVIPVVDLAGARAAIFDISSLVRRSQAENTKAYLPKIREYEGELDHNWRGYYDSDGISGNDERTVADKVNGSLTDFRQDLDKQLAFIENGDTASAEQAWKDHGAATSSSLVELVTRDFDINVKQAQDAQNDNGALARRLEWMSVAAMLIGALISAGAAFYLVRAITVPLNRTIDIANGIEQGRLDGRIVLDVKGEFGRLLAAMKSMNDQLAKTVRGIRDASTNVTVTSGQISSGNQDLSSRTEQQASSLEQTAASMTQLTETVKQNTENARQANHLATDAREMTNAGNAAVVTMVSTINEIRSDSEKIAHITGMIESIAFQTNILALNAAVEAARAGADGRGFAVVAGEVRSLAQRASAAAKEIKGLIESSAEKVQRGSQQATEVNATMSRVIQAIGRVSNIVSEISSASEEQSKGIEQVHEAIHQIDRMTQQNAALVEESAAAALSLQDQAARMRQDVTFFRLGGEAHPAASGEGAAHQ